jgi:diguanylate cyclase (GGDEF)-like protein
VVVGQQVTLLTEVARRINDGIGLDQLLAFVDEQVGGGLDAAERSTLEDLLGSLVSTAAQNDRLFAQVLSANAANNWLDDLSRKINQTQTVEDIARVANAGLARLVGAEGLALYVLAEGMPTLLAGDGLPDGFPQTVSVVGDSRAQLLGMSGAAEITLGVGCLNGRPTLVELLRAGKGGALGLMIICLPGGDAEVSADVRPVVSALAGHLAVSLDNARLLKELVHHATFDDLTGLAGRRHFMTEMHREIARARRDGRPLSLLMIDADRFKAINDTHGHPAGDAVLIALAHAVEQGTRTVDICGRLGGEELGVLLPQAGSTDAVVIAERIRRAIRALSIQWKETTLTVTVSIGVGTWHEGMQPEDLMAVADQALYRAKDAGRDRVESEA